jgi:hypothetical protein
MSRAGSCMNTSSAAKLETLTQPVPNTRRRASRILLFPALFGPTRAQTCGNSSVMSSIERKFLMESLEIRNASPLLCSMLTGLESGPNQSTPCPSSRRFFPFLTLARKPLE